MASSSTHSPRSRFESLEVRRLLSGTVVIDGTDRADTIRIRQSGSTLSVTRNGVTTRHAGVSAATVHAKGGNDSVFADGAVRVPLSLYGGTGSDTLVGGAGDDVLVSIGGDRDTLTGGGGHDNFWVDAHGLDRMTDLGRSDVYHSVGSFMRYRIVRPDGSVSTTRAPLALAGQRLPDPVASKYARGWKNFSDEPLFVAGGPAAADVDQNGVGDCYFLAALSSVADAAPQRITDRVVDLGDGTYAVHFERDGVHYFVRVDADLPVAATGKPFYAGLGREGSIWAPVLEKAWTFFRSARGTYDSIEIGKLTEPYHALGLDDTHRAYSASTFGSAGKMLSAIDSFLREGNSVVYSSLDEQPAESKLRPNHVLMVDHVVRDARGVATGVVLRDPYKADGPVRDGANDGYLTLTASQAAALMEGLLWCEV